MFTVNDKYVRHVRCVGDFFASAASRLDCYYGTANKSLTGSA